MITAYHRPQSLDEALKLLARSSPSTVPLGGGTLLSHGQLEEIEVVDLQALGLNGITERGQTLHIGAAATLQKLLEFPKSPPAMRTALRLEAPLNLRNAATVGGTLIVCDGRSSFVTVLLALDARLSVVRTQPETIGLGDFLAVRSLDRRPLLITGLDIPRGTKVEFDYVARTPADTPIVAVALAQWPSGRTRLAVCGHGAAPALAMDGKGAEGIESAARNALRDATDPWGSAEYRMDVAVTLSKRCLGRLNS
jgi:CO/xanthine dehydrogenase FAD-binding subunit